MAENGSSNRYDYPVDDWWGLLAPSTVSSDAHLPRGMGLRQQQQHRLLSLSSLVMPMPPSCDMCLLTLSTSVIPTHGLLIGSRSLGVIDSLLARDNEKAEKLLLLRLSQLLLLHTRCIS